LRPGEVSLAELEAAFLSATPDAEAAAEPAPAPAPAPAPVATAPASPLATPAARSDDAEDDAAKAARVADQSIRVGVDVLENLMTMVSELVLTRNQLLQMIRNTNDSEFKRPLQRLSAITAELQEGVMKTRMQPIGNAWKKLPRIVRDAARDLGKKIDLVLEGEGVELDRQVLELIKDPLTHMIRNSCDHGLETPDVRRARGKADTGTIKLSAYHEGGHIIIEIGDDGAGLNTQRIREKAIEKGVVTAEAAAGLSETQIQRFIFAPGFSTAAQVTNMSGRGVGMDVVKTNIEVIGGTIDLQSSAGKGTTFFIKIPLTLAIVSALVVGARSMRFAVPQLAVVELVRAGKAGENAVETLNATRVMRLRDRLLPLVDLSALLGLPPLEAAAEGKAQFVVVMQVGGRRFGLVVDEVFDTEEIVVKPMASVLRDLRMFSGNTILGDGSVIMIVDPSGVAAAVGDVEETEAEDAAQARLASRDERTGMIIFRAGAAEPKAAPLALVTRLEELDAANFERANGQTLVQYRGKLMPIISADPYGAVRESGPQPILVFTQKGQAVGIAVDEIIDIVDERLELEVRADTPGQVGVAVLRGAATEIIDVGHYLSKAIPAWDAPKSDAQPARRVLLVEGDAFFRNLLAPLVAAAGYVVETAENADSAMKLAARAAPFDVVLADIDRDAAGARMLAGDERLSITPRIALTGSPEVLAPDFHATVRKSDRMGLVAALEDATRLGEAA
jgi:two-component system chemotaxis sensor kinase CheA